MEIVVAFLCGLSALAFALVLAVVIARRGQQRRDVHLAALARPLGLRSERGRSDRRAVWYWGWRDGRPVGLSLWAHKVVDPTSTTAGLPIFLTNVVVGARATLPPEAVLWRREPAHAPGRPATSRDLAEAFDVVAGVEHLPPAVVDAAVAFVQRWPALRVRALDAAWRGRLPAGWPADAGGVLVMADLRTERVPAETLAAVLAELAAIAALLEAEAGVAPH